MSNFEEPPYKKSKEEPSPSSSLPDDVALSCLARVWRSDAALSLLNPRVIALQKKEPKFKLMSNFEELPDDVALSCLARLSRSDHAALSLLSKRCRSLAASPELYKIRSRSETYVYVCLRTPPAPNPRWYILRDASDLIPIPSFPSQSPEGSSVVALDWGIYVIGGLIKGNPTWDVLLLDCRTHTWRQAPSMGVARAAAAAAVVDGKIYVLGGCKWDDYSLNWGEVFDPQTQTWDSLPPMPFRKKRHGYIHDCVVRDRRVYAVDKSDKTLYYSPSEGKWGIGNRAVVIGCRRDWCMIDNLIYALSRFGKIFWCEKDELDCPEGELKWMNWSVVNGLEALEEKLSRSRVVHFGEQIEDMHKEAQLLYGLKLQDLVSSFPRGRLSNCDGNILLFWDEIEMMGDFQIWCAEVSLERRQGGQIWGNIEWSHAVMTYAPRFDRFKGCQCIGEADLVNLVRQKIPPKRDLV